MQETGPWLKKAKRKGNPAAAAAAICIHLRQVPERLSLAGRAGSSATSANDDDA